MSDTAVLRPGCRGEAVRDLQLRLGQLGYEIPTAELGRYDEPTVQAVRSFQETRRLRVDGICGPQTWEALVESGYRLGDRLLYRRRPMLRGDDVADLQRRLNALGFDAGREDGILGDDTHRALVEFQRNVGLPLDGICGSATIDALDRVSALAEGSVATVRERETLRRGSRQLSGRRVYVAAAPGFEAMGQAVVNGLLGLGAGATLDASGADDATLAETANRYHADLFLGFRSGDHPGCCCSYFETGRFRSEAGYRIALAVRDELVVVLGPATHAAGRAYAVLRETRMAAVMCEPVAAGDVAAMRTLVRRSAEITSAVVRGVQRGVEQPPSVPA